MPQPLSARTADFTDSVIRRMTRVSLKYGAVNLSQGFPDFDPPREILDRLSQVSRGGPPPVLRHLGRPEFPGGPGKEAVPLHGPDHRPGQRDRGHLRLHRGHDVRHDDRGRPRRQGHRLLPLLRELRGGRHPLRRGAHLCAAASAGLHLRRGRAGGRLPPASQGADPVQSLQPLRPGLHPGGAADHRRDGHQVRRLRHHRRGLRAHRLRPPSAHLFRHPAGDVEAGRSPAPPCPRPTPSPAGGWATSSPRRRSPTGPRRSTTSSPWAAPRRCRRR